MGAYSHSNGSVEETTSSARSFFSRFALPIRSRSRNLADFHVRPKDPHRQYSAGDHVHGAVVLTVVKPVRITHLTVALHGYVRVHKGPAVSEPPVATVALSGRSSAQYHGNGYASLFQDEQVLSGEGRLEAGKYEFNFDLVFPEKGLPSSIDFERGTISYMITATLTRPTSIAPTTSCDRKLQLVEQVDIGPLAPPRPRTIYLEPISKKSRRRKATGNEKASAATEAGEHSSDLEPHETERMTESPAPTDDQQEPPEHPRSPTYTDMQSEISGDSTVSSSTGISLARAEPQLTGTSLTNSKMQAVDEKTITATIEMLRGGALPGDTVSVKVSVQHIKRIKSMHGVIVTMYRQGRIDTAPPASMFADIMTKEETRKLAKEDYYPRSRTGLGGLSLTSTSSLSVFRKDLSQSVAPLIIDPATLETTVTASVKVPEDVFPTIKGVPGEMVSFKYQVEVLVDLGGRLANQLQGGGQSRLAGYAPGSGTADNAAVSASWGTGNVIDTDRLRREKGVISVVFEVILGTTDSTRLRGRSNTRSNTRTYRMHEGSRSREEVSSPWRADDIHPDDGENYWPQGTPQIPGLLSRRPTITVQPTSPPEDIQAPAYIPPPQVPDENNLTEKERVRRQEERLLPSQPPQTSEAGPSSASAPEPNIYDAEDEVPSGPPETRQRHSPNQHEEQPSAPTLDDFSFTPEARTEDKQELERQRLLNEASAPPEFPDDCEAGPSASAPPPDAAEPSAPVLTDEDDYGQQYSYRTEAGPGQPSHSGASEPLPRYER
ncbi:pH-response regulator protein palF/prr-3 [Colletotrichum chlorophyti]|uniref:pH-response regulator protein palF/prr-3 n=1 Tax=Colletotrichum chlorophyti TaxID=708187 RepID=A0A1Q8RVK8_9PEZI|nr:pH-response regulator protein palF/prr-3 [Colletotrichum chlorophyti]